MNVTRQIGPFWPARFSSRLRLVLAVALAAITTGCAHSRLPPPPVKPWQREYLSKRAMVFDADPLEARFRQHMFGSREAADGGYGQPGGGCGCN
jgi:hypothetical protein